MSDVIVAKPDGEELGAMLFTEYDFEIGDFENTFLVTCLRSEWEKIEDRSRIYIPGTEYGGIYRRTESKTKLGTLAAGGYTWRGMLQNKIIEPPSGQDYATDAGELNAIIGARVSAQFPGLFVGSSESTGVTVTYRYNRYVTLYDGLKSMLKSAGYKMQISYDQDAAKVIVRAVPIVDYSDRIEYSSDMNANYEMIRDLTGVNHLICLGQGELRDRTVVHLYVDANGNISQRQTYYGADEIAKVYDYAGAARTDLIKSGSDQLKQYANETSFKIDLESDKDVDVGDIVGGRDYISAIKMTAPITAKVVQWRNGFETTEYKLSDEISIEELEETAGLMSVQREGDTI